VLVERGHLILEDGIGERKKARFPRVGHGIRRLVVIGSDGVVSLAALRWLADQNAAFVMLDRDGSVLAVTGPVRPSDARLRRAQALAHSSGVALEISRELIRQKIEAQATVARERLRNSAIADSIYRTRDDLGKARTIDEVRSIEAQAASDYWSAWRALPVNFPNRDLRRVPDHWRTFGTRASLLTGSPRLATNPANAMLNYLYAVLESETRLAIAALGLDPGLGVLHADSAKRDSLASDIMEPIRPRIDAYLFDWISRETLRREWFFEQGNGCCRLIGSFAVKLSETARTWANAVAPTAEWVFRQFWSSTRKPLQERRSPTHLTQSHRRESKGAAPELQQARPPRPESSCEECGAAVAQGYRLCRSCRLARSAVDVVQVAKKGRIAAQSDQAQKRRSETQRKHTTAIWRWKESDLPSWLSRKVFIREIQPRLAKVAPGKIKSALRVSMPYAIDIRKGRRIPHPRHWLSLAKLTSIEPIRCT
jgi:CRISPR-associated endonuclease Cas1